jgi:uncharacterized membrane protein
MDIPTALLSGIRVILGFLLVLLIPGLLITLVYFPRLSDLHIVERLVYAAILSIGSVIVCVLFMDVVLGIDTTPINVVLIISTFCLGLAILWLIRRVFITFSVTEKITVVIKKITGPPLRDILHHMKNIVEKVKRGKKTTPEKTDENLE